MSAPDGESPVGPLAAHRAQERVPNAELLGRGAHVHARGADQVTAAMTHSATRPASTLPTQRADASGSWVLTARATEAGVEPGAVDDHGDRAGTVPLNLLLVGSSGGHLAQLTALGPWSRDHHRHWVCFDTPDAVSILRGERVTWAHHPTTRHLPNLLRNLRLAWRVLRTERPDVVLSTGAGVALPFFVLARLSGVPTVYLEVYDRVDSPTLTGRLCRPFATRMLVQWSEQRDLYRDAEVVGCVL
jgi:Oligosaccharide biosynthesis protein Alg14 like